METTEIVEKWGRCPRCGTKGYYIEQLDIIDICMVCFGEGKIRIQPGMKVCGNCKGNGFTIIILKNITGISKYKKVCDRCKGKCVVICEVKKDE